MEDRNGTEIDIVRLKHFYFIIQYNIIISRFYRECLLPEIVDLQFGKRLLKSDIRESLHIQKNISEKKNNNVFVFILFAINKY